MHTKKHMIFYSVQKKWGTCSKKFKLFVDGGETAPRTPNVITVTFLDLFIFIFMKFNCRQHFKVAGIDVQKSTRCIISCQYKTVKCVDLFLYNMM